MPSKTEIKFFIISDSVGETALNMVRAALAQFTKVDPIYYRFPFTNSDSRLDSVLKQAETERPIIIQTLVTGDLSKRVNQFAAAQNLTCYDLLSPIMQKISQLSGETPRGEAGAIHRLNDRYFDRISAMEFAVMYDDGKDPKGFLEADIVLLGVSRTSKTPLSLFLANRNLKVANLPLVPSAHIPEQIWQVDPKKIIGLTTDVAVLNNFRRERMIAYGLNPDTAYSDMNQITAELDFARQLYDKIGCYVINTAHRSIEETATLILEHMGLDHYGNKDE
ncbi:kinase/pyrophosphorylase [Loigolactobacillus coryniformis]|jgi:regulator of PEP synthase PpsR (kinase-PPPase family)|uniref:Putative pyruvate, phosphate dikinase regulatory protein n=3 Tax=Loigolactobacillus coryniformis TaxID=1610 RepID=J3JCL1_9LACO|nr:pyruvate, water dikinase regulatory protein [Loigolactobacillus coryniformis]MDT3392559.1 kinase/pyrophosphorylase [Bacillota bacterium]RRG07200.1 MAG: kinase/pyrophosphorylase [Lactobacillus sp.]ATO43760.1 phosphoenolpyruvate synthase regulatory protein [Loigolactobacillus coryniformis subsp. torquens DSM 20004 = KCTC 3535]ATO55440.1 phosphoenolpyruvate synthase regulatory protein [Loigolactobacillus coryniformis subsp. coryniformis KCTC 3167 = DSM 20001]EJN56699.1 Putative phosphotransfer